MGCGGSTRVSDFFSRYISIATSPFVEVEEVGVTLRYIRTYNFPLIRYIPSHSLPSSLPTNHHRYPLPQPSLNLPNVTLHKTNLPQSTTSSLSRPPSPFTPAPMKSKPQNSSRPPNSRKCSLTLLSNSLLGSSSFATPCSLSGGRVYTTWMPLPMSSRLGGCKRCATAH